MKILFLLTYYEPYWTGLTRYAKVIAEGLAEKSFFVRVLTTQYKKNLKKAENLNNVQVIRKPTLFRFSRTFVSPQFLFAFWKKIKQADSVIIFLPFAEAVIAALIAKILKKKLLLVHNGDLVLSKGWINLLLEKFYYLSTDFAISLAEKIIIQTEDYANNSKLLSKHKDKWGVILPPFKMNKPSKATETFFKRKMGWNGQRIIGFAGRFVEEKGFDYLLKAIPEVKRVIPNVLFVFAGESQIIYENFYQQNQQLINKNRDYLRFLGLLDQKQMPSFYSILDLLVVSSRTDCFPFVQVEALLSGIPVVVTDIPGARWVVLETKMGKVVDKEDPEDLARGIIDVLKNREEYTSKKDIVKKLFDYDKSLKMYEQLVAG